jgi:hypothetical protein
MITQETLMKYFYYDPTTGDFYRILRRDRWGNEKPIFKLTKCSRSDGYLTLRIFGKNYKNHRLCFLYMTGKLVKEVDHINGDRTDNRWSNLRPVTRQENTKNRGLASNNKSGASGVTWFEQTKQWRARITFDGVRVSLGLFDTLEEAILVRKSAEKRYQYHPNHGERQSWRG